jgi:hypothetical protein
VRLLSAAIEVGLELVHLVGLDHGLDVSSVKILRHGLGPAASSAALSSLIGSSMFPSPLLLVPEPSTLAPSAASTHPRPTGLL